VKILAHIHTYNDEDVIERSLAAVLAQSRPADKVLIVDNASTDGTLQRKFPDSVTVIRNSKNLGTSGSVVVGMNFALQHEYDWIWILDADSAPHPDALEQLLKFLRTLPAAEQTRVQRLASLGRDSSGDARLYPGIRFTRLGYEPVRVESEQLPYECDGLIWSGGLFQIAVIRAMGLPDTDYVLDWGEFEYGYQSMRRGYKTYVVPQSRFSHNIGTLKSPSLALVRRFGPLSLKLTQLPPIRLYYLIRNTLYFWLRVYHQRSFPYYLQVLKNSLWVPKYIFKAILFGRWADCKACSRGLWDGLLGNMHHRF
jgi:GT2 family glycosyltransferase